jgi:hypothetical protein
MQITNPCGKCIVRASCKNECKIFNKYCNNFAIILSVGVTLFLIIINIILFIICYKISPYLAYGLQFLFLLWTNYIIFTDFDDDIFNDELENYQKILIVIFGAWLYIIGVILYILDDNFYFIDYFVYKYKIDDFAPYLKTGKTYKFMERIKNVRNNWKIWKSNDNA